MRQEDWCEASACVCVCVGGGGGGAMSILPS